MSDIDIAAVCRELRSQHKTMSEEEKDHRSECDFLAAKEIITMLQQFGKAVPKLVEVDTELTKVLRQFVDFERLFHGEIHPKSGNFYDEELPSNPGSLIASSRIIKHITSAGQVSDLAQHDLTHSTETTRPSDGDGEGEHTRCSAKFLFSNKVQAPTLQPPRMLVRPRTHARIQNDYIRPKVRDSEKPV